MIFIDSDKIGKAATYNSWINCMENAFLDEPENYIMPPRAHINFRENTLLLMPCIREDYFATKLVSLFPGNLKTGKEALTGLVVLNDGTTGEPLAIIDGPKLTAMRTGAVGSVAVRHLAPANVKTLGIIGTGIQGIHQTLFACSQRDFSKILIYDINPSGYDRYNAAINKAYPGIDIHIADDTTQLCSESEVIITTTSSVTPVIPDNMELVLNKTIIGIGSYKPGMREFPDAIYSAAKQILIDTTHGISESGDLKYPIDNKLMDPGNIISIARVLKGEIQAHGTKIFKSVGMALFDLYSAVMVYETIEKTAG